jgi:hypothetical protein
MTLQIAVNTAAAVFFLEGPFVENGHLSSLQACSEPYTAM